MAAENHEMVLRERRIDMLRVLALQDDIWELTLRKVNVAKLTDWPRPNDDDSYLAIAAIVGALAEFALHVDEPDLGALVVEVDQAWKQAIAEIRY
jgi:hypothetical protein